MKEPTVPIKPRVVLEVARSLVMNKSRGDAIQKNE
jgi:hypothetical protein